MCPEIQILSFDSLYSRFANPMTDFGNQVSVRFPIIRVKARNLHRRRARTQSAHLCGCRNLRRVVFIYYTARTRVRFGLYARTLSLYGFRQSRHNFNNCRVRGSDGFSSRILENSINEKSEGNLILV